LPVLLLFDRQVPHIPGVATMSVQGCRLFSRRKQPVTRHNGKVAASTDKSSKGEMRRSYPVTSGGFRIFNR
jgi:hypothetical protein